MPVWGPKSTAEEVTIGVDLTSKLAIVTGASSGLGAETARVLALRGARVIMTGRDLVRGEAARRKILLQSRGLIGEEQLELARLDLSSLESVRTFAREYRASKRPLHLLINNAGALHRRRELTADGFEAHFGTNHLGHFLLTSLLLDTIEASAPARIISVSSAAMTLATLDASFTDLSWEKRKYNMLRSYADSKLMNLMFVRELGRRLSGTGIVAHAVHPGVIPTRLSRDVPGGGLWLALSLLPRVKTVAQGAATTLVAATAPGYGQETGLYLSDCRVHKGHRLSRDPAACRRLWEISERLVEGRGHAVEHSLIQSDRPRPL